MTYFEEGTRWKKMAGDLVISLSYETVFVHSKHQSEQKVKYSKHKWE